MNRTVKPTNIRETDSRDQERRERDYDQEQSLPINFGHVFNRQEFGVSTSDNQQFNATIFTLAFGASLHRPNLIHPDGVLDGVRCGSTEFGRRALGGVDQVAERRAEDQCGFH